MYLKINESGKVYSTSLYDNEKATAFFSKEIWNIYIYSDGVILAETDKRFEPVTKYGERFDTNKYLSNIESITIEKDFKRAIKFDLNRKDNFYINASKAGLEDLGYVYGDPICLFINASEFESVVNLGEALRFENSGEKCYQNLVEVMPREATTIKYNRVEYDTDSFEELKKIYPGLVYGVYGGDYGRKGAEKASGFNKSDSLFNKIKEKNPGAIQTGIAVKWKEEQPTRESFVIWQSGGYTRVEKNAGRINREELAKIFEECGVRNISHYDIEKLEQRLDITIKEKDGRGK